MKSLIQKGKTQFTALMAGVTALVAAPMAFASGGSGADLSPAITAMNEYKEEALVAILALIVILWTLRATGVLKPRS